jgi:hypothetical protein
LYKEGLTRGKSLILVIVVIVVIAGIAFGFQLIQPGGEFRGGRGVIKAPTTPSPVETPPELTTLDLIEMAGGGIAAPVSMLGVLGGESGIGAMAMFGGIENPGFVSAINDQV